jgi:hypothetical protein
MAPGVGAEIVNDFDMDSDTDVDSSDLAWNLDSDFDIDDTGIAEA